MLIYNFLIIYSINEALIDRKDPTITNLPDDDYFYFYIGYHLKESNILNLFPILYLDYGFLETKLRITGLPSTLEDLSVYRHEIAGKKRIYICF